MADAGLPSYSALPRLSNGLAASWGVFGPDDELGTANLLTNDVVVAAAAEVRTGERINVTLPLNEPSPSFFGRSAYRHKSFAVNDSFRDEYLDGFFLQGSTNWDGMRHKRDPELGFYNAVQPADILPESGGLGFDVHAQRGILGRGVLADVARNGSIDGYDPFEPWAISPDVIESTLQRQGVCLRAGDVLMIRTGFIDAFLESGPAERERIRDRGLFAGLSADDAVVEYLWDNRVATVAADNPGVERMAAEIPEPDLHARLIPMLGMPMGEFFDFRRLSAVCEADHRYTSMFVSIPLNIPGAVGSPGNALVIR